MKRIEVEDIIGVLEPLLTSEGYELVDLEYKNEQMGWTVRVYIDKEGGVGIDDCTKVSREMSNLLDVEDIIPHKFHLEVSSPGLNRPLRKREHFLAVVGERIKVKSKLPIEGARNFKADLLEVLETSIVVDDGIKRTEIDIDNIDKANLIYKF